MKTKEEILNRLQNETPSSIPTFKAMDEYAKHQAIDFALNYAKSFHSDTYTSPTEAEMERMSRRYDLFIEAQSKSINK